MRLGRMRSWKRCSSALVNESEHLQGKLIRLVDHHAASGALTEKNGEGARARSVLAPLPIRGIPNISYANHTPLIRLARGDFPKVLRPQCRLSDPRRPLPHTRPWSNSICKLAGS